MLLLVFATIVLLLLFKWIKKRLDHFQYFEKLGIPGPKPNLLSGNAYEFYKRVGYVCVFNEWHKNYGPLVGFFSGYKPTLLVADIGLIKQIFIKDFTDYTDRYKISGTDRHQGSLLGACGSKWKAMRQIITPSFTSSKLKTLAAPMHHIVKELVDNLEQNVGKTIDLKLYIHAMTLDVVTRSALGANYGIQKQPETHTLFKTIVTLFKSSDLSLAHLAALSVNSGPFVIDTIRSLNSRLQSSNLAYPFKVIVSECARITAARRQQKIRCDDLLQLIMDASAVISEHVKVEELAVDENVDEADAQTHQKGGIKLSDKEVVQNAFAVLVAGFETTGSTLTYLINALIHHPEIQDKLIDEIRSNLTTREDIADLEKINQLTYMNAVIKETLRMFPPVGPFSARIAKTSKTYGNIKIPEGLNVVASIREIHYSRQYWNDPQQFDPSRFLRGEPTDPVAWQPFGVGPRNCVGMRFALMEIKMAVAEMLSHFRFEKVDNSPKFPPDIEEVTVLVRLKGELLARVVRNTSN